MKSQICIASLMLFVILGLALASVPAVAGDTLYSNGPVNGYGGAWNISDGSVVSDSINLNSSRSNVYSIELGIWMLPGESLLSLDWSITSAPNGGTVYGSGTAAGQDLSSTFLFTNSFGYDVYQITASGLDVRLDAGTYWLNEQKADGTLGGQTVYWDENSGPSMAYDSTLGTIPSESFTLLGASGTTPEPGSLALFGSGALGLAGLLRRRFLG